ncbi:hypothetical protein [Marinomonas epiphytica]
MQQNYKARYYPMLVTLCALEHLNNLDDLALKKSLTKHLTRVQLTPEEEKDLGDHKIHSNVVELANQKLSNTTMVKAIEPFVLPSIESIKPVEAEK